MLIDNNALAQIFQRNLDNRLSVELANGMIGEILKLLPTIEPSDGPPTEESETDSAEDAE